MPPYIYDPSMSLNVRVTERLLCASPGRLNLSPIPQAVVLKPVDVLLFISAGCQYG